MVNTCGCTDCPEVPVPPGKCGSYIASAAKEHVGDCAPEDLGCFCKRDGVQNIHGTAGCPSYPVVTTDPSNSSNVWIFYNVGDGNTVGLASGPPQGPWTVVQEPILTGFQNAWPYHSEGGVLHVLADKLVEGGGSSMRHLATPDGGKTWVVGKEDFVESSAGGVTNRTKPRMWLNHAGSCSYLYTQAVNTHNQPVEVTQLVCTSDGQ
eukprot:Hpha_TRINITY_DN16850_c1_g3::TRINITY_DN16850_c1_g3_i2::g.153035::m.153035